MNRERRINVGYRCCDVFASFDGNENTAKNQRHEHNRCFWKTESVPHGEPPGYKGQFILDIKQYSKTFSQCAVHQACDFTGEEAAAHDDRRFCDLVPLLAKNGHHFFAEQSPIFGWIQAQKSSVDGEHRSTLLRRNPQSRQPRDVLHTVDLTLQIAASSSR